MEFASKTGKDIETWKLIYLPNIPQLLFRNIYNESSRQIEPGPLLIWEGLGMLIKEIYKMVLNCDTSYIFTIKLSL